MDKSLTIAVIGLGLIGGSILKSLKYKSYELIAIARREETIQKAKEQKLANVYSTDISVIKGADIVFICTPINKIKTMIDNVIEHAKPNAIITDVASLKGFVMEYIDNLQKPVKFIGGHPMAGTEHKGIDSALDDLYIGAKWVLTPSNYTSDEDIKILKNIINSAGAKAVIADAKKHDFAVGLISHMPLFLSQALYSYVSSYPDEEVRELALKLAASGFRDTTRLAATNVELAQDMIINNKQNVLSASEGLKESLTSLENLLSFDKEKFIGLIADIAISRMNMYSEDGKNKLL